MEVKTTNTAAANSGTIESAMGHVMKPSDAEAAAKLTSADSDAYTIKGYDLNQGVDYRKILAGYMTTGFQATNFAKAVHEINRMVSGKLLWEYLVI